MTRLNNIFNTPHQMAATKFLKITNGHCVMVKDRSVPKVISTTSKEYLHHLDNGYRVQQFGTKKECEQIKDELLEEQCDND